MLYELCDMGGLENKRCAKDFRKRAIDQLVETSRIYKKLKLKGNLKLVINEENLLVVEE